MCHHMQMEQLRVQKLKLSTKS